MMRRAVLLVFLFVLAAGTLAWVFGPRVPVDGTVRFDAAALEDDPAGYSLARESAVPGLTQETAKEIVWADPETRARTLLSVVYVHGYSGDKRELRPVPDEVARRLGANLFFTRLSGHGLDFAALAEPSANDWLNDVVEALAIGRALGERVVLMSTSTGGTLTAWAASLGLTQDVAGFVMISPNFALQDWRGRLATLPFAQAALPLVVGAGFELQLAEPAEDGSRTALFPSQALLPMAALVEHVRGLDVAALTTPALFLYSPSDQVVNARATEEVVSRWGGPAEVFVVDVPDDPFHHMLAGDLFSPSTTQEATDVIARWIEATILAPPSPLPSSQ